jgi:hypothetical protein
MINIQTINENLTDYCIFKSSLISIKKPQKLSNPTKQIVYFLGIILF